MSCTRSLAVALLSLVLTAQAATAVPATSELAASWFNVSATDFTDLSECPSPACLNYEAQAVVFTLSGIVNRNAPRLLLDLGNLDVDFPAADEIWKAYFEAEKNVTFSTISPDLCSLVAAFAPTLITGAVNFTSDGYSLFLAMTAGGLHDALPVSPQLALRFPCLAALPPVLTIPAFPDKLATYAWGMEALLPHCSPTIVYNADFYPGSDNGPVTLMSADYPIASRAFIMNIAACWDMVNSPPCNSSQIQETQLFMAILETRDNLVSVFGWSDPEHAYTNATTHAGGTVFCTFSTSNLAFWAGLGVARKTTGLPVPTAAPSHTQPDPDTVYLLFETNEGDTPRILTSLFVSAWLSPLRGTIPVAWAVDPILGEFFPELWNYFMLTATMNDTFLAGVDGAGYVYVHSLGDNALAYEQRAAYYMRKYNIGVVDVGVANIQYPAVTLAEMTQYRNSTGSAVQAFVNACGSSWGQGVNSWLADGTPVINSVCAGPGQQTNYLFYYRDTLSVTNPGSDLANRISWAAAQYAVPGRALFLLVFGGLGVYGGYDDFFNLLQNTTALLANSSVNQESESTAPRRHFQVVGAPEMARLARLAAPI